MYIEEIMEKSIKDASTSKFVTHHATTEGVREIQKLLTYSLIKTTGNYKKMHGSFAPRKHTLKRIKHRNYKLK